MRRFALLILLSVLPAFAAVETTTVNGKVVLSDGSAATAGSITCTLSTPGTALDGSTSQRVAGSDTATIGSDGTITGLTLVPNDAITPTGTTYKCAFNVSSPRRVSWDETWSVTTSPDPVNVGSITRYNVAPGITAGSFLLYVTSEPSGSCTSGEAPRQATATGKTCTCSAGTWSCLGGGASAPGLSGAVPASDGSGAFVDSGVTAASGVLTVSGSVRAYDTGTDGAADIVPSAVSRIAQSVAHAAMYSPQPDLYLQGGVIDVWTQIARNHGPADKNQAATITQAMSQCPSGGTGTCASDTKTICVSGSSLFASNDVIVLGTNSAQPKIRSHVVTGVASGTGTTCPVGTNNQLTVYPAMGTDEGYTGTSSVTSLWQNASHLSSAGYRLLGYKIGVAPLARDGVHGPDLLPNGAADHDTPLVGWEVEGTATTGANSWINNDSAGSFHCVEGTLNSSCFYLTGGGASDILRTPRSGQWITVQPGERYALSGVLTGAQSGATVALEGDIDENGTLETYGTQTLTGTWTDRNAEDVQDWFWATFDIPSGLHRVRVRFARNSTASFQVDGFSFRRVALPGPDSVLTGPAYYLLNDPGSRNIVITGDSWAVGDGGSNGDRIKAGLVAAFQDRLGRDLSSQIIVTGKSGITTVGMLTSAACTTTGGPGYAGSLNCWEDSIGTRDPLYVIVILGTNDAYSGGGTGVSTATYVANMAEIRRRIRSIGAIPIIVGVAPVGNTVGASSIYNTAHSFDDALRKEILGAAGSVPVSTAPTGATGDVQVGSGGALASAVTGTALDLDGNGTAGSADFDGNGTGDELGSAVGNLKASRLFLPTVDGSTGVAHVGAIASAWAHAAKYGDPHYYLRPAVFDAYSEVFRGAPLESAFDYDGTSNPAQYENVKAVISGCVGGVCTGREFYICVDDQDWDGTIVDTDGDGTAEIEVNDVVVAGTSTTTAAGARSHRVTAIVAGTAPDCGTANARLTVVPNIDEAAELDSNSDGTIDQTTLHNLWWQMVHPGDAGSYLLGYRLMYGSRARDGNHGANLLNNGEMEHDGTLKGWTLSTGTATSRVFNTTPATSAAQCFDGNGTADCFSFATTTSGASISSADVVATPGETLILSGYIAAESGDDVGLACDSNSDGTYALESGSSIDVSGSYWDLNHRSFPGWFWHSYTIPSDCTSLKAWIAKGGTTTDYPTVDGFSLKRSSTWLNDSSNGTQTSFLINDPGARNIILTGDSWTRPDGNGADIIAGMEAAAQTRFGRDLSAQIFATGVSGYTTADVLTNFYALIEKYEPLYVVVNVCTNDVLTGVTQTNFIANQKTLAARIMAIGAIPIFVSCPPLVQDENADRNINSSDFGAATKFNTSHTYRDAQRAALLNWAP